mmetsp:Transcript_57034/g.102499  ORF Transcript_57034/g.102499 Transcript_57034/m.102499 type:complete len:99 (+) Transcript_57034:75-371(+)
MLPRTGVLLSSCRLVCCSLRLALLSLDLKNFQDFFFVGWFMFSPATGHRFEFEFHAGTTAANVSSHTASVWIYAWGVLHAPMWRSFLTFAEMLPLPRQ